MLAELRFWICQGYKKIWETYFMVYVWQHSEFAFDSGYAKVLNMLGLNMILNDVLYDRVLNMPCILNIPLLHGVL